MILKLGLFCILACMVNADQTWYNFKSTWTALVYDGFWDHPRTESEAKAAGWRLISNDCSDGIRYSKNCPLIEGSLSLVPISISKVSLAFDMLHQNVKMVRI